MEKTIYMNRKTNAQVEVLKVEPVDGGRIVHYKSVNGNHTIQSGRHRFVRTFTRLKGDKV